LLVSLKEALIVFGMVLGYTVGYAVSERQGGWRYTYACSMPFACLMFLGMTYLPFSARWLALKGRFSEARMSLKFVNPKLSESEFEAVKEAAEKAALANEKTSFADDYRRLTSPTVLPAMIAGVGLVFFQQVTGQPSVLYYADTLFLDVGLSSYSSILVSLFKLVATLVATFTVDSHGRKLLLYIGCSLMLIALIGLGTAFLFPYSSSAQCNEFASSDTCISSCVWDTATCGTTTCLEAGNSRLFLSFMTLSFIFLSPTVFHP
jgi:MFS family permease